MGKQSEQQGIVGSIRELAAEHCGPCFVIQQGVIMGNNERGIAEAHGKC